MKGIFTSRPILGDKKLLVNGAKLLVATLFLVLASSTAFAQTDCAVNPSDCALVSRVVLKKALEDSDTVKQQKAEIAVKDQAIDDFRKELNNMRVEYAGAKGELSECKQNAVGQRAIIDILLKHVKPKKIGLINF